MEVHTTAPAGAGTTTTTMKRALLILCIIILAVGNCGGPLIMRLYFIHGGRRIWFSSFLQTAGWPAILVPLAAAYLRRRRSSGVAAPLLLLTPRALAAAAAIGALVGADNYLYAYGMARLPVSTSSLIVASQLAFTAAFAFLLVGQRLTAFSVNAVVLLTVGAAVLGIHSGGGDRPPGVSKGAYVLGFLMTLASAALYGLLLPLVELIYRKSRAARLSYALALEVQLVTGLFATAFCTVGMIFNHDFPAIGREAKAFELGETNYYILMVGSIIIWQCFFVGMIGVIYYSSSLLSAIIITVLLPVTEILAVIFYGEKFGAEKGISLFLSLWGFISYFYGEIKNDNAGDNKEKNTKSNQTIQETELTLQDNDIP